MRPPFGLMGAGYELYAAITLDGNIEIKVLVGEYLGTKNDPISTKWIIRCSTREYLEMHGVIYHRVFLVCSGT